MKHQFALAQRRKGFQMYKNRFGKGKSFFESKAVCKRVQDILIIYQNRNIFVRNKKKAICWQHN